MARIAVKAAVALVVLFLASIFFLITIFCSVNVASKRNEGNVTSEDITPEMFDPDAAIDPSFFDNSVQMDFIITAYFPDSPDDPYGGNDTCADGTKYWRDPNTPPERNLFALTPDQRVIQGVCAIVQDMHAPQVPWSLKDLVKLGVPAYNQAAEIHGHFGTVVTDPRRLDLAMSGKEQHRLFFDNLAQVCPEAKPYRDPSGSPWNSGTIMPVTVQYPNEGLLMGDDGHYFPIQTPGIYNYRNDWHEPRPYRNGIHEGNDIFAPEGTPSVAVYDGLVTHSSCRNGGTIAYLATNDQYGASYAYMHNKVNIAPAGTWLPGGQALAQVGRTGCKSTPAHIHFEMRVGGVKQNPFPYLQKWESGGNKGTPLERSNKFMRDFGFINDLKQLANFNLTVAAAHRMDWRFALVIAHVESSGGRNCFRTFNPFGYGTVNFSSWQEAYDRMYAGVAGYGYGNKAYQVFLKYNPSPVYAQNCTILLDSI